MLLSVAAAWLPSCGGLLAPSGSDRSSTTTRPTAVVGGLAFTTLSAGGNHTCALTPAGDAYCWGQNDYGEIGDGVAIEVTTRSDPRRGRPTPVAGGRRFKAISAGFNHTCAITLDGAAYCWGSNVSGQLANRAVTQTCRHFFNGDSACSSTPVPVDSDLAFESIDAGASHTCALTSGGRAYCWGVNSVGQLGDGTTVGRTIPTAVAGGLSFQALSGWGGAFDGALGTDALTQPCPTGFGGCLTEPAPVTGGLVFVAITLADDHSCGLAANGAAYCWGNNDYAQLGID